MTKAPTKGQSWSNGTPEPIRSWSEFSEWIEKHNTINWLFRGLTSTKHLLVPKIGRRETHEPRRGYTKEAEIWLYEEFKRLALAYIQRLPTTDWEWLALAQHHGLPTRLLDWTHSPLVAAYFAVEKEGKRGDAVIYACEITRVIQPSYAKFGPFTVPDDRRFDPPSVSPRIIAQAATFTIHRSPTQPFSPTGLDKIVIDKRWCGGLKGTLNNLGINRAALFPDMDGVATDLLWQGRIREKIEDVFLPPGMTP